jgi:bifunctional non-homologous end joining protein LigD
MEQEQEESKGACYQKTQALMGLQEYKRKRSFDRTEEPTGGKNPTSSLRFVVQKHHASHLHYDFRLEMKGVLKSWAVPKGPSLDPSVTRLAMMVEDHPYDYRTFEGIIPEGNYGAGTVIIWDEGYYEPAEKFKTKKEKEHYLLSNLYKGDLKFILHGKKLKGKFLLVRAPQREQNSWLLKKIKDQYASTTDVSLKDKSVVSHLTLEQMAVNKQAREWISNRSSLRKEKKVPDEEVIDTEQSTAEEIFKRGKKSAFPEKILPMLATKIKEPFNNPDWIYEVKWDGYRIIAHIKNKKVVLHSRSAQDYTRQYAPVAEALKEFDHDAVVDGEVVVLNDKGFPDFDALQKFDGTQPIAYYVFDLIWYNGYNLTALPLLDRKELLSEVLFVSEVVRYSDHFDDGMALFKQIKEREMEGIVAKKIDSTYSPGKRSQEWLKIPTTLRQEFVIGGWAESESGRPFRTLLFGNYVKNKLHWVGHAGGGFKDKDMPLILKTLKKLEIKKSPFVNEVEAETPVHWVKPALVAEIKFASWTKSRKIRKPAIFLGFRKDKNPREVKNERVLEKPSK